MYNNKKIQKNKKIIYTNNKTADMWSNIDKKVIIEIFLIICKVE